MENIIKTLLLEGIDEAIIHHVLDVIEEEYELVSEESEAVKGYIQKQKSIRRNLKKVAKGLAQQANDTSDIDKAQKSLSSFYKTKDKEFETSKKIAPLVNARKEEAKLARKHEQGNNIIYRKI